MEDGKSESTDILLDSSSTCLVFCNDNMLINI